MIFMILYVILIINLSARMDKRIDEHRSVLVLRDE